MTRTRLGRQIYAIGGNPEAASRIGINILGVQLFAYGYLGLLAGLAGFIQALPRPPGGADRDGRPGAQRARGGGPRRRQPRRRHRHVGGVLLGILFLAMLQNGLNLLGVSLLLLRGRHRPGDPGLDLDDRLARQARRAAAIGARLMDDSSPA